MTVARRRPTLGPWLAFGAVAVLAGVVALAGPDGTPDGVATEPDTETEEATPTGDAADGAAPIEAGCARVDPAAPLPAFRLATADHPTGVRGRPIDGAPAFGDRWPTPPLEEALRVAEGAPLRIILATAACADAVRVSTFRPDDPAAEPALHESARFSTPSTGPEIGPLAPGDWSLRITVEYWSDASSSGGSATLSLAFRILVAAP